MYPIKTGQEAWDSKRVLNLLGGLDGTKTAEQLADNQAVTLQNVVARKGRLQSDTGYVTVGEVVIGNPQRTYKFKRRDLSEENILITTSTVYQWNVSLRQWLLLKGTVGTTTTAPYGAGATIIAVADATGFSTGDIAWVTLDNGSQLQGTITVSGLLFTFSAAVPAGRSIANGATVNRAPMLNGDADIHVSITTVPGSDWMVFTNGVDIVKRYDGTDVVDVPNLPAGGVIVCNAVIVYNTALFLIGTVEAGIRYNQRVRRSNQTDPTDWTGGTAGTDDLMDSSDMLLEAELLGPYLIVYRERGIVRGSFFGSGGVNYRWDTTISEEGPISAGAIANLGDHHVFVGHDNIYKYNGDFTLDPIGEQIFDYTLGYQGNIDPEYEGRTFVVFVSELDEIWIFYTSTVSTDHGCDSVIRYNLTTRMWYTRNFADSFTGHGFYRKQLGLSWILTPGTWAAQTGKWRDKRFSARAATVQLCSAITDRVMDYDFTASLDNTTPIEYIVETKDFSLGSAELRHDIFDVYMQGTDVLLEYSTDSGTTYNTLAVINQPTLGRITIGHQFVANKVRFRWSGSSADFVLEWFEFTYKIESVTGYLNNNL